MSLWNLLDAGNSAPVPPWNLRSRLLYWLGRRLAQRHKKVHIPPSALIHPGAKINPRQGTIILGEKCVVAEGAFIQGNVRLGDNCSVQAYTILTGYGTVDNPSGQITVGNGVRIASHVMMIAGNHIFSDPDKPIHGQGLVHLPIVIEDDVWVAGRVNIMAGVRIGKGSVIGAGSVVTHDVPPGAVVVGVPAKVVRQRSES